MALNQMLWLHISLALFLAVHPGSVRGSGERTEVMESLGCFVCFAGRFVCSWVSRIEH
jgi:hypothetical protein